MKILFTILFLLNFSVSDAQDSSQKNRALPDHVKLQFAGSIGFLSLGAGYETRNKNWDFDLFYGYVPESIGGVEIHTLTAKTTFSPIKPLTTGSIAIRPLSVGAFVAYTFGEQYFLFNPEKYPLSYYDYPTALHIGAFLGGRISKESKKKSMFSNVGLYYEVGTNDREFISYIHNKNSIKFTDIINIGIGLRGSFRSN